MARYRQKNEDDLRWNRIRRRLTREFDTRLQDFREVQLNKILSYAWEQYAKSLETGEKLEIESDYKDWVTKALEQSITVPTPERADDPGA